MAARLVWPRERYFASYVEALREFRDVSSHPDHFEREIADASHSVFRTMKSEKASLVPTRTFWLVDTNQYVGTVQIRLSPGARYPNIKSNVYFDVRPSRRRKGYGTQAFALAIKKARALGLKKLMLSCDSSNAGSKAIIEAASAKFIRSETVPDRAEPVLMFELDLDNGK